MNVWRCWIGWHDSPLRETSQERRHTVTWRCPRCQAVIGTSTYPPSAKLRRTLKVNPKRRELRLVNWR
jgi:hypothetical protein